MRWATALAVIAVAWAGAVYVHQRTTTSSELEVCNRDFTTQEAGLCLSGYVWKHGTTFNVFRSRPFHPKWEDPVAVLLAVGGLAVAAGVATTRRRHRLASAGAMIDQS